HRPRRRPPVRIAGRAPRGAGRPLIPLLLPAFQTERVTVRRRRACIGLVLQLSNANFNSIT
ncbi:hypothetical protein, partial [Burkholderia ubonensis]|uniref:hypothetical protein n=1 Tax=Burkholderia ubonensis TaxID=101571 RepID=UPI001C4307BA